MKIKPGSHKNSILIFSGFLFLLLVLTRCAVQKKSSDYPIHPVPFTEVKMKDQFWLPRMEINRTITIPHAFKMNESTGRVENFTIAAGLSKKEPQGEFPFDDTDIYKTLEGASYALMVHPDPKPDAYMDSLIALVAAAQEEDGYLYTVRTNKVDRLKRWFGDKRWEKLESSHELYNAGHLFEAAAAHYQATGKRNLLNVAIKFADFLVDTFGPGKLEKAPGHQVVEMGLAKLYRVTGKEKYIDLAKFFLDIRGTVADSSGGSEYNQTHKPVLEQDEAVGHAVRAGYMYAGMADVAALKNDPSYITAIDLLWDNVAGKKLYLTGGIGSRGSNEGFGPNYELPNMSAYNETCASIANVYWNHRLFLLHGDAKYIDVMERTLYNALLSGVSLDGRRFFYPNPLESIGQHERSEWFGCACCPGNVTRFLASVPGYIYATKDDILYVNLYGANSAGFKVHDQMIKIIQETGYPWDGTIKLTVVPDETTAKFNLKLRIPGWVQGKPLATDLYRYINDQPADVSMKVNGREHPVVIEKGYVSLDRDWNQDDTIELVLPMPVRRVAAHDSVKADAGMVALERGPIIYCAEWPEFENGHVRNLLLKDETPLESQFEPDLLNGVRVIRGKALSYKLDKKDRLQKHEVGFTAIPYHAWANRGKGEMAVWFAREESAVRPLGLPTIASKSKVTVSFGKYPEAINDQLEPSSSMDHEVPFYHWWPNKGTKEWVRFDFEKPHEVSTVNVYWFDDTGIGECRIPKSWRIVYLENGDWKPVYAPAGYTIVQNQYNEVIFETVRTKAIQLEIQSQDEFAGGIHEVKIK